MEKFYVRFPNEDAIEVSREIIEKWDIDDLKIIGDTVFFWTGGVYVSMEKEQFEKIFPKTLALLKR